MLTRLQPEKKIHVYDMILKADPELGVLSDEDRHRFRFERCCALVESYREMNAKAFHIGEEDLPTDAGLRQRMAQLEPEVKHAYEEFFASPAPDRLKARAYIMYTRFYPLGVEEKMECYGRAFELDPDMEKQHLLDCFDIAYGRYDDARQRELTVKATLGGSKFKDVGAEVILGRENTLLAPRMLLLQRAYDLACKHGAEIDESKYDAGTMEMLKKEGSP
jgi:hypothetical protein